jgi:hypothetical protein
MIEVMALATTLRQVLPSMAVALGMLAWVGPVHAQRIVAFVNKDQEKSKLDRELLRAIAEALSEFQKAIRPRPTRWGPDLRPSRLARATTAAKAQFGIDTLLWRRGAKVYTLLVVRSDGVVVLEQGVRLGARSSSKRITTLAHKAARAIQKRSKGASTPPTGSAGADGASEPDAAEPLTNLGRVDAA